MDELVRQAHEAWAAQDWERSARLYEQLAVQAPDDPRVGDWWYDAALAYKFRRNWAQAYRLGIHAAAYPTRGTADPAFWNLGIAATIQRDWPTARDAWEAFGIPLPPGDGPIVGNFGRACVRLVGSNGSEVVWVQRLCPTRARLINVPFDTSRRYGEVVVHDGEPKGDRVVGDRTFRVFDELMLFEPSDLPTLTVTVTSEPAGLEALAEAFGANDFGFEPLRNGYVLCKCCSEGAVTHQDQPLHGVQRCLIAAPLDDARQLLDAWQSPTTGTWAQLHIAT
jgi:hypothetical protein